MLEGGRKEAKSIKACSGGAVLGGGGLGGDFFLFRIITQYEAEIAVTTPPTTPNAIQKVEPDLIIPMDDSMDCRASTFFEETL